MSRRDDSGIAGIPLHIDESLDIWDGKYRLKKRDGTVMDRGIDETYRRVAPCDRRRRGHG